MKVIINKKLFKTIIALIVSIIIIAIGILTTLIVSTNINIKNTEEKLSQINVTEFEEKIIEELKNTNLYLNLNKDDIVIATKIQNGINEKFKDYITIQYVLMSSDTVGIVEIPCFKINKDSSGNFKNIEYVDKILGKDRVVKGIIEEILNEDYGIKLIDYEVMGNFNRKYNKTFNSDSLTNIGIMNEGEIYVVNKEFLTILICEVEGNTTIEHIEKIYDGITSGTDFGYYTNYSTDSFGIF